MVRSSRTEVEWFLELINADLGNSSEDDTYELLNKKRETTKQNNVNIDNNNNFNGNLYINLTQNAKRKK